MPMILQPSLLDRTWNGKYAMLGSYFLMGSLDIGLEKLTGHYAKLGSPVLFWSNAV